MCLCRGDLGAASLWRDRPGFGRFDKERGAQREMETDWLFSNPIFTLALAWPSLNYLCTRGLSPEFEKRTGDLSRTVLEAQLNAKRIRQEDWPTRDCRAILFQK